MDESLDQTDTYPTAVILNLKQETTESARILRGQVPVRGSSICPSLTAVVLLDYLLGTDTIDKRTLVRHASLLMDMIDGYCRATKWMQPVSAM